MGLKKLTITKKVA